MWRHSFLHLPEWSKLEETRPASNRAYEGEPMIIVIEIMLAMIACMVLAGVILFVARMIGTLWGKKND